MFSRKIGFPKNLVVQEDPFLQICFFIFVPLLARWWLTFSYSEGYWDTGNIAITGDSVLHSSKLGQLQTVLCLFYCSLKHLSSRPYIGHILLSLLALLSLLSLMSLLSIHSLLSLLSLVSLLSIL